MTPIDARPALPIDPRENELQQRVITAVRDLFAYTNRSTFRFPIPNTTPTVIVAAGESETLREVLAIDLPEATPGQS